MTQPVETLTIQNRKGIHARAAAKFVKLVETFDAQITVKKLARNGGDESEAVSGNSILALMMLGADFGSRIEVSALGNQAEAALAGVRDLINRKFDEE